MVEAKFIAFIARSNRRKEVLKILNKDRMSQPTIMKKTGMYKGHTSRTLKELSEQKLIICENPKDRSFRFYKISKKGTNVLKKVDEI